MAEGAAEPLGVTVDAAGVNVAVVAPDAEWVEFCVFDADGAAQLACHRLAARIGDVWHGHIAGVAPGTRYGFRAGGPWDPAAGHHFDPAKLLLDPWARAIDRPFRLHPTLFARGADTAAHMPKGIVVADAGGVPPPPPRVGPRVIYELHVRGFTRLHPDIPEALRGTFAGLAHPAAIAHLRRLGVTRVELLPVAAGIDERHLPPLGLTNYWNYNPVAWLAPDPQLAPGGMREVRAAVDALRAAGIGVILDVVFNHSGEGDAEGPTLSLRGLANAGFYRLLPGGALANDAGCGNTLALDQPWPLRLAMDAMRHWVVAGGVDGFRLDLATTLGRRETGFDRDAPLLAAMRQDPVLRDRIIIAEPWDLGAGGYRLGEFPAGWGEWNDRFRDTVRCFWRGDAGQVGALATRLAGSADVFGPYRADSLNFVAAHDGFTLADLVAFTAKRNAANGEANRDGTNDNQSWNCGVEGPTEDAAVLARRAGDVRALLATLLVARGTPMLAMGDEAGRSQGGNNNAYAQDNAISWLDWAALDQGLVDFTARLIAARLAHPALHARGVLHGDPVGPEGLPDVAWLREDGTPMAAADWAAPARRVLVAALYAPARGAIPADRVLVALNAGEDHAALRLPPPRPGQAWDCLADSADPKRQGRADIATLAARSVLLLAEKSTAARPAADPVVLRHLAQAAGIAPAWHDLAGREHQVPEATLRALLAALHLPAESAAQVAESLARLSAPRRLPARLTLWEGAPATIALRAEGAVELDLLLEDGTVRRHPVAAGEGRWEATPQPDGTVASLRRVALPALPTGRHRLLLGETECALTVAPATCFLPADLGRRFGIAAQIYALRRKDDQGIGDYTALAELARAAKAAGAALLGISPPHALPPRDRSRASPYQPSDRRFLEPVLIDVTALGEAPAIRAALAAEAPVFAALAGEALVDYPAVWTAKRRVLRAAWRALPRDDAGFAAFRAAGGQALAAFARFTAQAEAADEPDGGDFHAFLQWVADRQLAAAATAGAPLYRDLAVGAAPDGAEVAASAGGFLAGLSIGAPPDVFAPEGQVWGLPAPDPRRAAAAFGDLLRANMRHAAALRIDHVMGLARLFLVPEGAPGADGAYLQYPLHDMLGTLTLESQRARCLVVGEDLGTVPPGFRQTLDAARVLSYRVLWFERQGSGFIPPEAWPARAAACVSTHDLPTLAGWWEAVDIAEREALGLLDGEGAAAARAARASEKAILLETLGLPPQAVVPAAAIHAHVTRTPSALLLAQAEDLVGERIAVNLPGTNFERPNWRRRLSVPVGEILQSEEARAILTALRGR